MKYIVKEVQARGIIQNYLHDLFSELTIKKHSDYRDSIFWVDKGGKIRAEFIDNYLAISDKYFKRIRRIFGTEDNETRLVIVQWAKDNISPRIEYVSPYYHEGLYNNWEVLFSRNR